MLDMFPYPSGEGLHVGHPLGYIASDIFARFKNIKVIMCYTLWGMTLLVFRQNNMLFKQVNILPNHGKKHQ